MLHIWKGGPNITSTDLFIFHNRSLRSLWLCVPSADVGKMTFCEGDVVRPPSIDEGGEGGGGCIMNYKVSWARQNMNSFIRVHVSVCVWPMCAVFMCVYSNEGRCSFPPTGKSNLQCLRQVKCSDVLFKSQGHFSHLRCKLETRPHRSISRRLVLPLLFSSRHNCAQRDTRCERVI